nr:prepilin-type N-terminal cleavage/methylation domain-containing protein [uncultured Anaerotignum sp.]
MMKKLKERKGFTMAELLIVVAIVAVLVAVSIPVFTGHLEKARQATDAANIRAAYAEAVIDAMNKDGEGTKESVAMVHTGGFDKLEATKIGDKDLSTVSVTKGKTVTVTVSDKGAVTITPKS